MALHWNVEKVESYREVCYRVAEEDAPMRGISKGDRVLTVTADSLIHATQVVGMGSITSRNWRAFYARLSLWEDLNGAMRWRLVKRDGEQRQVAWPFEPEEVRAHVGLSTNALTQPVATWLRRVSQEAFKDRCAVATRWADRSATAEAT